jgi:hypothetical protein
MHLKVSDDSELLVALKVRGINQFHVRSAVTGKNQRACITIY